MSAKSAKKVEMGFKIPEKALSRATFAPWAQNERPRSQKKHNFLQKKMHFCAQNALGVLFAVVGDFWLQKRAQMLMFSTVWRSG